MQKQIIDYNKLEELVLKIKIMNTDTKLSILAILFLLLGFICKAFFILSAIMLPIRILDKISQFYEDTDLLDGNAI